MFFKRFVLISAMLMLTTISVAQNTPEPTPNIIETLKNTRLMNYLPDLGGREITVALENEYPPFNSISRDGVGVGWDYDALRELCARLNCVPRFTEVFWDDLIKSVSDGRIDMAANGVTRTVERYALVDFSMPYISLYQVLLVRNNDRRFSTLAEFIQSNVRVWAIQGSTNYDAAVRLVGEARAQATLDDAVNLVLKLIDGRVDAVVFDSVAANAFLVQNKDALMAFPEPLSEIEELALIFTNGSDLTAAFNIALETMRLDGTLAKINQKWFVTGSED